ncbi:MAG: hypothetical protein KAJ29_05620 [Alphaproteobacteria bacterium]|nr:hypothetical protein [Alphaproteobacteria bacterium]
MGNVIGAEAEESYVRRISGFFGWDYDSLPPNGREDLHSTVREAGEEGALKQGIPMQEEKSYIDRFCRVFGEDYDSLSPNELRCLRDIVQEIGKQGALDQDPTSQKDNDNSELVL